MTSETMPGDTEAAAAMIGMVEQYGTKADEGASLWASYVYSDAANIRHGQPYYVHRYKLIGTMPGGLVVVQLALESGDVCGEPKIDRAARFYATREAAMVAVAERLLDQRETITQHVAAVKAQIQANGEAAS